MYRVGTGVDDSHNGHQPPLTLFACNLGMTLPVSSGTLTFGPPAFRSEDYVLRGIV